MDDSKAEMESEDSDQPDEMIDEPAAQSQTQDLQNEAGDPSAEQIESDDKEVSEESILDDSPQAASQIQDVQDEASDSAEVLVDSTEDE